jgi:hypothetical protein
MQYNLTIEKNDPQIHVAFQTTVHTKAASIFNTIRSQLQYKSPSPDDSGEKPQSTAAKIREYHGYSENHGVLITGYAGTGMVFKIANLLTTLTHYHGVKVFHRIFVIIIP